MARVETLTENILASDSYSASARPRWCFFVAGREPGWLHSTGLIKKIFVGKALSALAAVDFHVPFFVQKRGRGTARPYSVVVRDSSCRPVRVRRCGRVSSSALLKLLYCERRRQFFPSFFLSRTPASNTSFACVTAGSVIMQKGLFCGGERRKRSMVSL